MVEDSSFTCVVRRSPDKAAHRVCVTPSYKVECPCRHDEKMLRSCDHAVATIKAESTLVGLPKCQDVMDYRWIDAVWHLQTWRAQHADGIKHVSLPAMNLIQSIRRRGVLEFYHTVSIEEHGGGRQLVALLQIPHAIPSEITAVMLYSSTVSQYRQLVKNFENFRFSTAFGISFSMHY